MKCLVHRNDKENHFQFNIIGFWFINTIRTHLNSISTILI